MQNNEDKFIDGALTDLVRDLLKEKRSDRRWKNIRFFLGFFFIITSVILLFSKTQTSSTAK